jgi:hypothetical protein
MVKGQQMAVDNDTHFGQPLIVTRVDVKKQLMSVSGTTKESAMIKLHVK